MKKIISILMMTAVALSCALPAQAQRQRLSPHETVSAVIDGNRVTITYGRPYTRPARPKFAKSGVPWFPTASPGVWARTKQRC